VQSSFIMLTNTSGAAFTCFLDEQELHSTAMNIFEFLVPLNIGTPSGNGRGKHRETVFHGLNQVVSENASDSFSREGDFHNSGNFPVALGSKEAEDKKRNGISSANNQDGAAHERNQGNQDKFKF
jgi:hypothetical protein